jgi:hypothetical protein
MDSRSVSASPINPLALVSDDGLPEEGFQATDLIDVDQEEPGQAHPGPACLESAQRDWLYR